MTIVEPKSYSIDVIKILGDSCKVGFVHSTFKKSLNITFEGRLINLSNNYTVNPPFGVQLEDWVVEYLINNLDQDECILWNSESKEIEFIGMNLKIVFNESYYYSQIVPMKINYSKLSDNISDLVEFITQAKLQNGFDKDVSEFIKFIYDNDHATQDELYTQLKLLENSLLRGNLNKDILNFWIGRGKGLTPSGDDFLVGVLALLSTTGIENNNFEGVKKYLLREGHNRTTQVGFEYLWYAIKGKYSINIINLCKLMMEEDKKELKKAIWNLSLSGHTSGVDTILGMILATKVILSKELDLVSKSLEIEK